jgi:GntR family transcriptional regulator
MTDGPKPAPLHEEIKDKILQKIILGDWPAGFCISSEMDLAVRFGVSYGTIRRAMGDLTQQDPIIRRRRRVTIVTGRPAQVRSRGFIAFTDCTFWMGA